MNHVVVLLKVIIDPNEFATNKINNIPKKILREHKKCPILEQEIIQIFKDSGFPS